MDEAFNRKYKKVLEILPDVAECAHGNLILAGGTALALFYLKHRISVDLDFVPIEGTDVSVKEKLKGCLTKIGYRTAVGAFKNQFIIQFEDTSIKIEIFEPEARIKKVEEHTFSGAKIKVASIGEILKMKIAAYRNRREARDLFDIFCIRKRDGDAPTVVKKLISEVGEVKNIYEIDSTAFNSDDVNEFKKVVIDASS